MKALLVRDRGSCQEDYSPTLSHSYLALFLQTLGYLSFRVWEIEPESGFDPNALLDDFDLLLVQGDSSGRMRRQILSNLGLSLGLMGQERDHLRVVGAIPLFGRDEERPAGFMVQRRGRLVCFGEASLWSLRSEIAKSVATLQNMEGATPRRPRHPTCWLLEGGGHPVDLSDLSEREGVQWSTRFLPDGDTALILPGIVGPEARKHLQTLMGERLYALEPSLLEESIGEYLRLRAMRLAVAESCTGGLISSRLTSVPGSSDYFLGGFIVYSNDSKIRHLEVPRVLIERFGAVSAEVALAMARGALRMSGGDVALSVTGIAGPGGGSPEKPLGTVYAAAVSRDGDSVEFSGRLTGGRNRIRFQAAQAALHLVRRLLIRELPVG